MSNAIGGLEKNEGEKMEMKNERASHRIDKHRKSKWYIP